jgi:hypothetical protein
LGQKAPGATDRFLVDGRRGFSLCGWCFYATRATALARLPFSVRSSAVKDVSAELPEIRPAACRTPGGEGGLFLVQIYRGLGSGHKVIWKIANRGHDDRSLCVDLDE